MEFKLYCNEDVIGCVCIEKQGLYYSIRCRLRQPFSEGGKLIAVCEHGQVDLGRCGYVGSGWGLDRYVSEKQLLGKPKSFHFVADWLVVTNKPFTQIEKLERAVLKTKDGNKYIKLL